jgi:HD-like signal output (HDOD) protein
MRNKQKLQEKIGAIRTLPTLPQVATRLIGLVHDPNSSASNVSRLIGQDASLSARVLRLANSAFYGMPRSITNLNNAVVILGLKTITTVVVSIAVFDMFPQDKFSKAFDRIAFWKHCLACGQIARGLASRMRSQVTFGPEEAFCAGLLHDIGKVIMEQYLHDDFHAALEFSHSKSVPAHEAEASVLGYDHCDVSHWLTEKWDLPSELHLPMLFHHRPLESDDYRDIIGLVHWADRLSYDAGFSFGPNAAPPRIDAQAVAKFKIPVEEIEKIKANTPEEVEKVASALMLG